MQPSLNCVPVWSRALIIRAENTYGRSSKLVTHRVQRRYNRLQRRLQSDKISYICRRLGYLKGTKGYIGGYTEGTQKFTYLLQVGAQRVQDGQIKGYTR
jgi:hypothetical protein